MEETIVLEKRGSGKAAAKTCRQDGFVPAVVYGKTIEPLVVKLDSKAVRQLMSRSRAHIHRIAAEDPPFEGNAMVQDVAYDATTGRILHIDLHRISLTEKVRSEIALDVTGEAELEKLGLILQRQTRQITVECLPADIPGPFTVDVSHFSPGDTVTAGDLELSDDVRLVTNPAEVLLVVLAPRAAEEPEEEAEAETHQEESTSETKPE